MNHLTMLRLSITRLIGYAIGAVIVAALVAGVVWFTGLVFDLPGYAVPAARWTFALWLGFFTLREAYRTVCVYGLAYTLARRWHTTTAQILGDIRHLELLLQPNVMEWEQEQYERWRYAKQAAEIIVGALMRNVKVRL